MATSPAPVQQAPTLPFLTTVTKYLNSYAVAITQQLAQEQADISSGSHVQAVNDAVWAAATDLAQALPSEQNNISAAVGAFAVGEGLIETLVAIFHHPKVAKPAAAKPAAVPVIPVTA